MVIKILTSLLFLLVSLSTFSQQLEKMILENWNNGSWENRMRELPFYDDEGRLIRKEIAHWISNQWIDQTKTIYNRDENGVLLEKETFQWNSQTANWESSLKWSYALNEKGMPTTVLSEAFDGSNWVHQSIDEYAYDDSGNVIKKQLSKWDETTFSWRPAQKMEYDLEDNRTTGYTISFWDHQQNDWQEYKRAKHHYNGETLDFILFETWIDGKWEYQSKRNQLQNDEGELNAIDVFAFEDDLWQKSSHVDYELNHFGKLSTSTSKKWQSELGEWQNLQRSSYYYLEDGTMISDWESNQTTELFPNPAQESLTIRTALHGKLTVLDALGKLVYQSNHSEDEIKLDISSWEMGAYSIQIDGQEIQQFLKQ